MSNLLLAWTIKAQFIFSALKIIVANQEYTYQEDFHKSETELQVTPLSTVPSSIEYFQKVLMRNILEP